MKQSDRRYYVYDPDEDRLEEIKIRYPEGMSHSVNLDLILKIADINPSDAIKMLAIYLKIEEHRREYIATKGRDSTV